jgi:REP element-mobilizing transposase RayT
MRISRFIQLWPENASVHLFWRCHNKEYYLEDSSFKDLFFICLQRALDYKDQGENCQINAFCLMENHVHLAATYTNGAKNLSNFMRYAHALFGIHYNKRNRRSGKVAEGRPKTPRIQDDYHAMQVQFYIEANPIRAGIHTEATLKLSMYSSYGFYAYGRRSPFTKLLTIPAWYLRLGKNQHERQKKYRKLFLEYLERENNDAQVTNHFMGMLIGNYFWIEEARAEIGQLKEARLSIIKLPKRTTDPPTKPS